MPVDYEIVHRAPGRIRLRVPVLETTESVALITKALEGCPGVDSVRANPACSSVVVCYDAHRPAALADVDQALGALTITQGRSGPESSADAEKDGHRTEITAAAAALRDLGLPTLSLALSLFGGPLAAALTAPLVSYNSLPILLRAYEVLRREHRLNVDFLDSLAIVISLSRGNLFTSAFMTWLITLGDYIRDQTAARSKRTIAHLLDYQGHKAWVIRENKKVEVLVGKIARGDTLVVYAGGMIPVDGEVTSGRATIDQKTITGESVPVERVKGDYVFAATVITDGKLYLRADRVGADTTAAQIVRMVETAPLGETRIQNYAETFADQLVAPSLALSGGLYWFSGDLNRLLSMVIIDYGTGIRVAAPTSVLAAMTHAARQGILVKGGRHLEKLDRIDTVVFDKTGTLTKGEPRVCHIASFDERYFPSRAILTLAAAAEARLKHPLARAVLSKSREQMLEIPERSDSRFEVGLGVEAQVNGYAVHVGSELFLRRKDIRLDEGSNAIKRFNERGCSTLLLAVDGRLVGLLACADQIRPEAPLVVKTLRNRGLRSIVMLTGDNQAVAETVSARLGIDQFFSEVSPADKAAVVQRLRQEGRVVAMVGDGINDSPALSYADVGVAVKSGADVAREAADVVLMEDNLWKLISALDISHEAIGLIRQNYAIIATLNTLALALAIPRGLVSPDVTALVSNGSAIVASLNAVQPILRY
jgi:Cu2+-exporting ATPase